MTVGKHLSKSKLLCQAPYVKKHTINLV
jgi:hypothetical protein